MNKLLLFYNNFLILSKFVLMVKNFSQSIVEGLIHLILINNIKKY